ncbi:hypothetical protein PTKIN_Ptkin01aG0400500 [Pterospermum kingtungense]
MEPDDPFGWIMEGCEISSSEEARLNACSYFGQSGSSDEEEEVSNHRMIGFGLDPDGGTEIVDADSGRAVDWGRDTDLGSQRIQADLSPNGTFRRESEEIKLSKRGFSPFSAESPSKRLKSLDFELPTESSGTPKGNLKNVCMFPGSTSNPSGMEAKSEGKRALPEDDDDDDDDELKDNETKLSSGEEDNERADEELEVNANGRLGGSGTNKKADEELNVNETETIHLDTNSDNLRMDVHEIGQGF